MAHLSSPIESALLGYLREQPLHGYEIYQRLSEPDGLWLVWRIKQSRLYAMLDRLENAGFVAATVEPQKNRPPRKVFHLTPAGERAFLAWVRSPVPRGRQVRLEFLVKLFFARREGSEVVGDLVTDQSELCRQWLAAEEASAASLGDEQPYNRLVHQFRIGQIRAMLVWLEQYQAVPAGIGP